MYTTNWPFREIGIAIALSVPIGCILFAIIKRRFQKPPKHWTQTQRLYLRYLRSPFIQGITHRDNMSIAEAQEVRDWLTSRR